MKQPLEARFRQSPQGAWEVQLVPEGAPVDGCPWRAWEAPDDPREELFHAIVPRDRHAELLRGEWRLRVRADRLDPKAGPMPPVMNWSSMYDHRRQHVFHRRWTLAEMSAPQDPTPWPFDGSVTVLGDPALASALRAAGVPAVHEGDATKPKLPRGGTLVVVAGATPDVAAVQRAALAAQCPLVVWVYVLPTEPSPRLLEVVPTGSRTTEPLDAWLTRLVRLLRVGHDAEAALALAASDGPHPADMRARWLRGTLRPWQRPALRDASELLRYWRYQLDRSGQEKQLTDIVNALVEASPEMRRRAHVVVVHGDEGAGLDYFRRRPLNLRNDLSEPVTVRRWEPRWSDVPQETVDALCETAEVDDATALVQRLVDSAHEGVLLVHCNHPVAGEALTVDALRGYVRALHEVAEGLDGHPVRLLVMVYVQAPTTDDFEALEDDEGAEHLAVSVLKRLDLTIPDEELYDFLKLKQIVKNKKEFDALRPEVSGRTYVALLAWLSQRYPDKLPPW